MKTIWCCECGHEQKVPNGRIKSGSVHYCRSCKTWWGAVHSVGRGGTIWFKIPKEIAKWYKLESYPK